VAEHAPLYATVTRGLTVRRRMDAGVVLVDDGLGAALAGLLPRAVVITDPAGAGALCERHAEIDLPRSRVWHVADELDDPQLVKRLIAQIRADSDIVVVGIGGGRVMDLVKFVGHQSARPVVTVPTSLATHVYASPKIHALPVVAAFGYEVTIDGIAPAVSLLDVDFLEAVGNAERRLLLAGFGDLLAFVTAPLDWQLAEGAGRERTDAFVLDLISRIVSWLEKIDPRQPLDRWVEAYVLAQISLCHITDWVGSAPASGAEHLFAHGIETEGRSTALHGELVALGTLLVGDLLGADVPRLRAYMAAFGLPTSLAAVGLAPQDVARAMRFGRDEGRRKGRYTIAEALDWDDSAWCSHVERLIANGTLDG